MSQIETLLILFSHKKKNPSKPVLTFIGDSMKVLSFPPNNSSTEKAQNLCKVLEQKVQSLQETLLAMPENANLNSHITELKSLGTQVDQLARAIQSKKSKAC